MGTSREVLKGIVIGLSVNAIWLVLSLISQSLGISSIANLLSLQFPLSVTIVAVLMVIPIVLMIVRARHRSNFFFEVIPQRPNPATRYVLNHFGVKWNVLYGGGNSILGHENYAFCEGDPLCPNCDYEMKAERNGLMKRYFWKCDRCGRFYKVPVKDTWEAKKIVERLLEAEIRSGRIGQSDG